MRAKELHKRRFGAVVLPQAGPFGSGGIVIASSLQDLTGSSGTSSIGVQSRAAPLKRNNITFSGTRILNGTQGSAFIWANIVSITGSAKIAVNGTGGGSVSGDSNGGPGGAGATGGGGGGALDSTNITFGGGVSPGVSGAPGEDSDSGAGGTGGTGFASTRWILDGWTYLTGGSSDCVGGPGYGGGGSGLYRDPAIHVDGAPGGGGSGGNLQLVCNSLLGNGLLQAIGGAGGADSQMNSANGGGGGTIEVYTRFYGGGVMFDVVGGEQSGGAGAAKIYRINPDLSHTEMVWGVAF